MKKAKGILKKLLIVYLIIYIVLSSMSTCFARPYDEKCGEYVAQYARDYIEKYASYPNHYNDGVIPAYWSGGADGKGTFEVCCSTFVQYMYQHGLGVNIQDYNINMYCQTAYNTFVNGGTEDVDVIKNVNDLKPGDIVVRDGHMEMFIGNGETANGGRGGNNNLVIGSISNWNIGGNAIGLRLTSAVDVNPAGAVPLEEGQYEEEDLSIYDENGFIYSGVAKLEGYESSKTLLKWIAEKISEIIDYIIGMATYGIRAAVVGWTAIIERFVIDGIVNTVTGVKNERVDDWQKDPNSIDPDIDNQTQNTATGNTTNSTNTILSPATGEPGDENYISEGMQTIADIGSNIQLKTTSEANVTIENIVYNKIPILDVNFFNFESAGGAVVDENGIIYIIKENVALWYYVFRIIAIIIMLLILIYTGIRMAISTVAETKAVYKQMLVSWVAGFILLFTIHYIIYAIFAINESFIQWLTPKYESGQEISLYESVRSKAYEIKATTGFTGMIMYMILVFYSIKFLIIYFKRFLTVIILAVMSPFVAVVYVIEKINKNGKNSAQILGLWLKDFIYTVLLQAMHALIYTVFITSALKLTETSIVGIFIAFIFITFMFKADKILRKVIGSGKSSGKLVDSSTMQKIAIARGVAGAAKGLTGVYGNQIQKILPAGGSTALNKVTNKARQLKDKYGYVRIDSKLSDEEKKEKREKQLEEKQVKKKRKEELAQQLGTTLNASATLLATIAKGTVTLPLLIAEPSFGIYVFNSTLKSAEKLSKILRTAKIDLSKPRTLVSGKKLTLKGIRPRTPTSARNLISKLAALNASYRIINEGENISEDSGKPGNTERNNTNSESARKANIRVQIANLRFAKGNINNDETGGELKTPNIEEISDELKIQKIEEILEELRKQEEELEMSYKEIVGDLEKQIEEIQGIDPEFAKMLQEKKSKELLRTSKLLTKPLSEKDILQAISNYKQKEPTFNINAEQIEQRDIEGITKEINLILSGRGEEIQMSKAFMEKTQREVVENHRKIVQEKERKEKNSELAGQDVSDRGKNSVTESKKEIKSANHSIDLDDRRNGYPKSNAQVQQNSATSRLDTSKGNTPHSPQANSATSRLDTSRGNIPHAPQANSGINTHSGSAERNSSYLQTEEARRSEPSQIKSAHDIEKNSALDNLVQSIKNASVGSDSKESVTISRRSIEFSKKIEELQKLGQEAQEITGEELYDLDNIYDRIEKL